MTPEALVYGTFLVFVVAIGLTVGSFLNVCIARMPDDRSLLPRSHCPHCRHTIRAKDNIPVWSWLWLRARCRDCAAPIGARYPAVEALGALVAVLVFRRFVPDAASIDPVHLTAAAIYFVLLAMLIVAAFVDVSHRIIPDQTSIYAVPFALAAMALLEWLGHTDWMGVSFRSAVLGSAAAGGLFALVSLTWVYLFRREGLGWGDVKLIALVGAFLGAIPGSLVVLLLSTLTMSVVGLTHLVWARKRLPLPFGPVLALCAAVYVLYGDLVLQTLFPGAARTIGL